MKMLESYDIWPKWCIKIEFLLWWVDLWHAVSMFVLDQEYQFF